MIVNPLSDSFPEDVFQTGAGVRSLMKRTQFSPPTFPPLMSFWVEALNDVIAGFVDIAARGTLAVSGVKFVDERMCWKTIMHQLRYVDFGGHVISKDASVSLPMDRPHCGIRPCIFLFDLVLEDWTRRQVPYRVFILACDCTRTMFKIDSRSW